MNGTGSIGRACVCIIVMGQVQHAFAPIVCANASVSINCVEALFSLST